jgi:hypothetical protein
MSFILAAVLLAKLPLVVRTYDSAGVSSRVLEHAQQSAGIALAAVGINPIWRPCHAVGCISKPKPHEVEIRFVKATALSERGSLGFAAVDIAERAGTLATVYVDRVDAMALAAGVDRGELLGRAMAHEVGHLLLGSVDHAPHGLMRATWRIDELRRELPLDWVFSRAEATEMRLRLAARVDDRPVVESIMADVHLLSALDDPTAVFKRAKRLDAGTRVTVTVSGGAAPFTRYFVLIDSVELVVLNVDAPGLPKRQILNMAIDNPSWMAATHRTIYKDGNVRVGADGVFVKDKKLAELKDVVERIPRERVGECSR